MCFSKEFNLLASVFRPTTAACCLLGSTCSVGVLSELGMHPLLQNRLTPLGSCSCGSKALRNSRVKRVNPNETFITNLVQKPESLEFDCKGNTFVLNTQILIIFFDKRIRIYIYFLSVINICRDIFLKTLKPFLYQWYIL